MSVFDVIDGNGTTDSVCPDVPLYLDVIYDCQRYRKYLWRKTFDKRCLKFMMLLEISWSMSCKSQ